ncbi:MAG: M23 family metallopeptidase [Myxococcales bacterium]|nr:M23 family metallopeptidase [Myxococcales bacterium]
MMSISPKVLRAALCLCGQVLFQVPIAHGQDTAPWSLESEPSPIELSQILTELEELRISRARTSTEIESLAESEGKIKSTMTRHTHGLVRLKRMGALPLAGGVDALRSHSARLRHLERLVKNDVKQLNHLRARQEDLVISDRVLAERIAKHEHTLANLQYEGGAELHVSAGAMADNLGTWDKSQDSVNDFGIRIHENDTGSASGDAPGGFAQKKGALLPPVENPSQVREAKRTESEGPGLEFVSTTGAIVRAVAAGQVAFADRYGSYGRIVIIDHGERYYTVYGGLGDYAVKVGDSVSERARIGTISSASNPPVLFFELRLGTRTLDAKPWLVGD